MNKVIMPKKVMNEIRKELIDEFDGNYGFSFLVGKIEKGDILIEGINIPKQQSKLYTASVNGVELLKINDYKKPVVGLGFYHGGMMYGTDLSCSELEIIKELSKYGIKRNIGIVFNNIGEMKIHQLNPFHVSMEE